MVDSEGTISIPVEDNDWETATSQSCVKDLQYRSGLSAKYNALVNKVQLVRASDKKPFILYAR